METALNVLEAIGTFILGVVGRLWIVLAGALVLALPALAAALVWRGIERRRKRTAGLPGGARVARNHTWVTPREDGRLVVGLDEVAQQIVPRSDAVELPVPGTHLECGDPVAILRAGERFIRIGSPAAGTVAEVNWRARREPEIVGGDPYATGWLVAIIPAGEAWRELPSGKAAASWLATEKRRLSRMLEQELGIATADGGAPLEPVSSALAVESWDRVADAFLRG